MGNGNERACKVHQQTFQPLDAVQIQVVGRLVQQQHIGLRHQRLRQGHALFGAARERADDRLWVQMQAVQGLAHALLPVPAVQRLNLALHCVQIAMALRVVVDQITHALQAHADCVKHAGLGV